MSWKNCLTLFNRRWTITHVLTNIHTHTLSYTLTYGPSTPTPAPTPTPTPASTLTSSPTLRPIPALVFPVTPALTLKHHRHPFSHKYRHPHSYPTHKRIHDCTHTHTYSCTRTQNHHRHLHILPPESPRPQVTVRHYTRIMPIRAGTGRYKNGSIPTSLTISWLYNNRQPSLCVKTVSPQCSFSLYFHCINSAFGCNW